MTAFLLFLALFIPPHKAHKPTPRHHRAHHAVTHRDEGISAKRATQIQGALVRTGYMRHASGHWDASTAAALRQYQRDHHWQTRFVPDARALYALGLVTGATTQTANSGPY
ncbi:MAG: peptidoglycan-binding protein [Terriglobales bacterium]